jgi:hypothetical protein
MVSELVHNLHETIVWPSFVGAHYIQCLEELLHYESPAKDLSAKSVKVVLQILALSIMRMSNDCKKKPRDHF